jgi:sporulation protein YlmC with PRC-barrel domain
MPEESGMPQESGIVADEPVLRLLSELGETVDQTENDVRGHVVEDEDGEHIGRVSDLVVDDVQKKVHFLVVERGGLLGIGASHTYVPVEAIASVTDDAVRLAHSRDHVMAAPAYAPDLVDDRTYHQSIYHHYGYSPFRGPDYRYAAVPYVR